jgi:uncharacterized protein (DUF1697 family)
MKTYSALLRGINVGGHKKFIKIEQLQMLEQLGFKNAQVYLHTGNWVFSSEAEANEISEKISEAIVTKFGWDVSVLVLRASELQDIFKKCPFSEEIKAKSYFTLLKEKPNAKQIAELKNISYPNEEYHFTDICIYFYPELGAGKAKMSNNFFENKLKVIATTRNYKTMAKLIGLVTPSQS